MSKKVAQMPRKNRLREQRELSRLSIYEVGKLLDVDPSTVSKHESNSHNIPAHMLAEYAKLYKCQTHELFFEEPEVEAEKS